MSSVTQDILENLTIILDIVKLEILLNHFSKSNICAIDVFRVICEPKKRIRYTTAKWDCHKPSSTQSTSILILFPLLYIFAEALSKFSNAPRRRTLWFARISSNAYVACRINYGSLTLSALQQQYVF